MKDNFNTNDSSNIYGWNDTLILDKLQEILKDKNIDELELTDEVMNDLISQLSENISTEEICDCAYIVAKNIDDLIPMPNEEIKYYILRLKNYLDNTSIKYIKAEFKGIEFEVHKDHSVEDIFNNFYAKYDKSYGITSMLFDLGLK